VLCTQSKPSHGGSVTETCSERAVEGAITTTGSQPGSARLVRGAIVYATGVILSTGARRSELVLAEQRPLPTGHYTLLVQRRSGHKSIVTKQALKIT